ncbi:C2H2 type zinc-finger-domain-containing protein [Schizophyllum fasciatum]
MADSTDMPMFTCMSCSIAFTSPDEQRTHYRSDHHRYNMKRRVAGLPPVSALAFNQKVLERRQETAIMSSPKGSSCEVCGKTYTTENAYRSHINSKKHKENELKAAQRALNPVTPADRPAPIEVKDTVPSAEPIPEPSSETPVASTSQPSADRMDVDEDEEDELAMTIDQKIAAARTRLSPDANCLFCTHTSTSLSDNLLHMSSVHSFFIPDAEYLVDPAGLIRYLGEKIAVGNVCIYCSTSSKEFRSLEAVRKHMVDKTHCKIAYAAESDKLEISDFYDFSTSYPDYAIWQERKTKGKGKKAIAASDGDEEWESDDDEMGDVDEVVEVVEDSATESEGSETASDEDDEDLPAPTISYGDTPYELVLPSGTRIGHRAKTREYRTRQLAVAYRGKAGEKQQERIALMRKMIGDKNSCLVPVKGDFGAFGRGTEVVKARNRGEAKEARRHVKEFRDQKRREDYKTQMGYKGNHQKHYRDPLLQ